MTGLDELRLRLRSVLLLALMHRLYSYRELTMRLGIASSMISRYIRGKALPSLRLASRIIEAFLEDEDLHVHLARMAAKNPDLLLDEEMGEALLAMTEELLGRRRLAALEAVVAANEPSLLLGSLIASRYGKPLLVAYTPPFLPADTSTCVVVKSALFMLPLCVREVPRSLRGGSVLLVYPVSLPAGLWLRAANALREQLRAKEVYTVLPLCEADREGCVASRGCICLLQRR